MRTYEYYRDALEDHPKPLAYVDIELFDRNIRDVERRLSKSGKTIRVASKSIRVPELIRRVLESSETYRGILSYSATEATFLSRQGFDDIIIAYPVVESKYIQEVLEEVREGKQIYFMVDAIEQAERISQIAEEVGTEAYLCIDVDMSSKFPGVYFGVYRSPINSEDKVREIGERLGQLEHVKLKAVMGYEAQIAGLPDHSPGRPRLLNFLVRRLKKISIKDIVKRRRRAVEILRDIGHEIEIVNGGGTGSVETTSTENVVTEVTVGSGFFSPTLFDHYSNFRHHPAVGFAVEVTRIPEKNVYTCHGGGYIASGSISIDKQPIPYLPTGCELFPDEGAGEVQTPVKYNGTLNYGDPIFFRHAKAGELCEHFNKLLVIEGGNVSGSYKTYRGLGQKFL